MGVKADRERAKDLYGQAAEKGNLKAMHNLAVISASPSAGTPDYATAAALFTRAAEHGLADSQFNLGVLYESGLGVPKDHAAAYKWYTLAARGGDADAGRRRDMLIARLPTETLQAMDRQIASWRPTPASELANNPRLAGNGWKQRKADAHR
jgi:localization factor PodJL